TAAMQGLAGGNLAQAASGAVSPYVAEIIHSQTTDSATGKVNVEANAMAHAVWGAIAAASGNNSALAGAAGAVSGELLGRWIAAEYYPDVKTEELSDEQKSTISALSTLAAGLMGGLSGGSSADAVAGAQAGKNAVENNYLSTSQGLEFDKEMQDCRKSGGDCQAVVDKWKQVSDEQSAQLDNKLKDNPLAAQVVDKELALGGIEMTERPAWLNYLPGVDVMSDEQVKAYVQYWNAQDLAKIDTNSPGWTKYAAFVSDPENQALIASAGMLAKDLTQAAISFMGRNTATVSVSAAEIGLKWGQGNMKQGMPWEDYVGTSLPADARLPKNFKTFDYYDGTTKTAVSAKSMDTQTMAKLANPNQVYSSIKGNIDAVAKFERSRLSGETLTSSMISNREIQLAIPANTTKAQWTEINRAIEYGKSQGVAVKVTQVK
ncbi:endonuclease toxin domain-containing protein, partial [Klebsiella aerogenes]